MNNQDSDNSESEDRSDDHSDDSPAEDAPRAQPLPCMLIAQWLKKSNKGFDGAEWGGNAYPMIILMIIAKDVGVRMMKKYFEIKVSKALPQNKFWKRLSLFSDEDYQAAKDEFGKNLLGRR